jgi:hypothetical protein
MSATRRQKAARQEQHRREKEKRRLEKLFECKPRAKEFVEYAPTKPYVRDTKEYSSLKTSDVIPDSTAKRERKEYTGDYIVGIATMHKSNLVPVGRGTDPKEFSTMRRN